MFKEQELDAQHVPCTYEHHGVLMNSQDRHQKRALCAPACPIVAVAGCSHPRLPAPRCHSSVSRLHVQRLVIMQVFGKRMLCFLRATPHSGSAMGHPKYPLLLLLLFSIRERCQSSSTNNPRPCKVPHVCMSADRLSAVHCKNDAMASAGQTNSKDGGGEAHS